jgi:hypothetical protein
MWFREPAAMEKTPQILLRLTELFGSVVFDDPALGARIRVTRAAVVFTALCLMVLARLEWAQVRASLRAFFGMESDALNLAIFRVVVFWQIYNNCYAELIARIASLPQSLQFPAQTGLPAVWILARWKYWPPHTVDPHVIFWGVIAMKWAAAAAAIGLWSRWSAGVVSFLFLFVWARLQWYGKVDHVHHLVWFALILMVSPAADALSVDSIFAALRRARQGVTAPPARGRRYGLPLVFSALLVGLAYFFPGFWKIWRSGLDWAFSDNPKLMMRTEWTFYGDWSPVMRFDRYPTLYHVGAFCTLLFELSFVFLLMFRRTRRWAPWLGLSFHTMTAFTLNIQFESLRNCYVLFFDWAAMARRVGSWMFPREIRVFYSAEVTSRRWVALLRSVDFLGRIEWVEVAGTGRAFGVVEQRRVEGVALYRCVAARIPFLWAAVPVLAVIPVGASEGAVEGAEMGAVAQPSRRGTNAPSRAVIAMGSFLLIANIVAGSARAMDGWPFACYPPFDGLEDPYYRTLEIYATMPDGRERLIVADDYRRTFGNRWSNLMQRVLNIDDTEDRSRRISAVWGVVAREQPELAQATRIRFVSVRTFTDPDLRGQPPDDPQLLLETDLDGGEGR